MGLGFCEDGTSHALLASIIDRDRLFYGLGQSYSFGSVKPENHYRTSHGVYRVFPGEKIHPGITSHSIPASEFGLKEEFLGTSLHVLFVADGNVGYFKTFAALRSRGDLACFQYEILRLGKELVPRGPFRYLIMYDDGVSEINYKKFFDRNKKILLPEHFSFSKHEKELLLERQRQSLYPYEDEENEEDDDFPTHNILNKIRCHGQLSSDGSPTIHSESVVIGSPATYVEDCLDTVSFETVQISPSEKKKMTPRDDQLASPKAKESGMEFSRESSLLMGCYNSTEYMYIPPVASEILLLEALIEQGIVYEEPPELLGWEFNYVVEHPLVVSEKFYSLDCPVAPTVYQGLSYNELFDIKKVQDAIVKLEQHVQEQDMYDAWIRRPRPSKTSRRLMDQLLRYIAIREHGGPLDADPHCTAERKPPDKQSVAQAPDGIFAPQSRRGRKIRRS